MRKEISAASRPLSGLVRVPGDKSVSHRALLFSAMASGTSVVRNLLDSEDVRSTARAVGVLGADVVVTQVGSEQIVMVTGWGDAGPRAPDAPVDCGNSGTTARLLAGVLAGWPIDVTLIGDESLSRRPMARVTEPLSAMGAAFETAVGGRLPMTVVGGSLRAISYRSPVASAQVKSCVLIAGTRASGATSVTEPSQSRDHTERMLPAFGVEVDRTGDGLTSVVSGPKLLTPCDVDVPGDPSSAAFFAAACAVVPESSVTLSDLMLNPTRNGAFDVLSRMGCSVSAEKTRRAAGEDVGVVTVSRPAELIATTVEAHEVPSLIDEIPVLAVVATQAVGTTRFNGVAELRVKESDRLEAIAAALRAMGAQARTGQDWLEVEGPVALEGAELSSLGDHRLAMAYHVAGLAAGDVVSIDGYEAVAISYPGFADDMARLESAT